MIMKVCHRRGVGWDYWGRRLWLTDTMKNLFLSLKGGRCTNHSPLMSIRHACRHQLGSLAWFIAALPKSSVDFCQELPGQY